MKKCFWLNYLIMFGALSGFAMITKTGPLMAQEEDVEQTAEYRAAQQKYLDDYAKQEGVVKRPGGLLVKRVRAGEGKFPTKTGRVLVNYKGMLADGTVFDSTYRNGQPFPFDVSGVIKGWGQSLLLMREGSKWEVVIPSHLAYGLRGGPTIPPYATLHFEVELISVLQ